MVLVAVPTVSTTVSVLPDLSVLVGSQDRTSTLVLLAPALAPGGRDDDADAKVTIGLVGAGVHVEGDPAEAGIRELETDPG